MQQRGGQQGLERNEVPGVRTSSFLTFIKTLKVTSFSRAWFFLSHEDNDGFLIKCLWILNGVNTECFPQCLDVDDILTNSIKMKSLLVCSQVTAGSKD